MSLVEQQKECANVYAFPPDTAVQTSGSITSGLAALTILDALFVAGDVGKRIIVEGAGVAGADLVTTIAGYTSPTQVTLTATAGTTVTNEWVRFRLLKRTKTNAKTDPLATVTDSLKESTHINYSAVGQINDPDWMKSYGYARLGSLNVLGFPFGYYDASGTNFIPLHNLYPGRPVFVRVNCARKDVYTKPKGRMFFGIWNNDDNGLEFARGADFAISSVSQVGTPAVTATTIYMIVIETDQGFNIQSTQFTVTNSPTEASYNAATFNLVRWVPYEGTLRVKIYRKIGAGNVYLLEDLPFAAGSYVDANNPLRQDTGSVNFPTAANRLRGIQSYWATIPSELDLLPVDGEQWVDIQAEVPFVSSINMLTFSDPMLVIGLTEIPSLYVTDGVTASSAVVTSAAAQFDNALHAGKTVIITNPADGTTATRTISSVTGANQLNLSSALSWTANDNQIEILEGKPRSIYLDLVGASRTPGEWDNHPEDSNRPQTVASNPNGSTQGNPTGTGGGSSGGGGRVRCVDAFSDVCILNDDGIPSTTKAFSTIPGDYVWYGLETKDGRPICNIVKSKEVHEVEQLVSLKTSRRVVRITETGRQVTQALDLKNGTLVRDIVKGDFLLCLEDGRLILESVIERSVEHGKFMVVSFELEPGPDSHSDHGHLMLINGSLHHNTKTQIDVLPEA